MSVQTRRAESGHWWVAALATRLVALFLNLLHASLRRGGDQPHPEGLSVSPGLIALGVGWAFVLAVLGGIVPAVRSARLPVAEALRQA